MVATIKPPFTEIIVIIDYIWTQFDFRADIVASRIGKKNALNVLYYTPMAPDYASLCSVYCDNKIDRQ